MSAQCGLFTLGCLNNFLPNVARQLLASPFHKSSKVTKIQYVFASTSSHRNHNKNYSSKQLTKTISIFTETGNLEKVKPFKPTLANYSNESRPLSILLCWLMAKNNAISKYAQFYLDQGFDVLTVKITPWQLLWPSTCAPTIANELLPILQSSTHEKKVIHGFSVGGYIFGQMLRHFATESDKYAALTSTMKAQIWDSPVDVNGTAVGVSKSVFLKSEYGQKMLENYINFHMNLFYSVATKYYDESHEYFYNHPLKVPALFLCSKVDPISTIDKVLDVQGYWKPAGINCTLKIWDNTQHVGHMQRYPEEYKEVIRAFLGQSVGGLSSRRRKPELATADDDDDELGVMVPIGLKADRPIGLKAPIPLKTPSPGTYVFN